MSKQVAVLLAGCGYLDGAEIHETVLTLLALDQRGAKYVCCAPDVDQHTVTDHLTKSPSADRRNVLHESARLARGNIRDVAEVRGGDFDALIIPGGFGVAKNLSNFAEAGAECNVNPAVERLIGDTLTARKPIGAICIAPALLARIAGLRHVAAKLTIGDDAGTAAAIARMGCQHENCGVTEFCVDEKNRIVSTPAYMLGPGPAAVFEGIRKLVDRVLEMCA